MGATRRLSWGLIGGSNVARTRMIPAINADANSLVAGIVSGDTERALAIASETGIPSVYSTIEEMLANPEIDVVYVSSTNERHKDHALAVAKAGKHLLCEKPLALTLADAKGMVAACHASNVIMGTNHHLRNAATHRTLRRLIAEGAIGQPLAVRVFHAVYLPPHLQGWRVKSPQGGGVILDITVHDADTLHFVLDDEPVEVTAMTASQGMASEGLADAVMGVIRFQNGVLAQFHDAFNIRHTPTGFEVHGTEGSLVGVDIMTQNPKGVIYLQRGDEREVVDYGEMEDLYARSVRLFNKAVLTGSSAAATGEDGVRSLAVALAAAESADTGRAVTISP
jgi:1,5-anhydro-D-fructose reductase (1,5-anhydro-D-mannitol-forming)